MCLVSGFPKLSVHGGGVFASKLQAGLTIGPSDWAGGSPGLELLEEAAAPNIP